MKDDRAKWNRIYSSAESPQQLPEPCAVLERYACFLPGAGSALDVACGRGGNALLLARAGLSTTAVDVSDHVVSSLAGVAKDQKLTLNAVACDIQDWLNALDVSVCFDVIVVSRFLDRALIPELIRRLNINGLVYYQTFVQEKATASVGPSNPDYLLEPNELLSFFAGLRIRTFYDPGTVGDQKAGLRNESYVVAHKTESL